MLRDALLLLSTLCCQQGDVHWNWNVLDLVHDLIPARISTILVLPCNEAGNAAVS